MLYNAGMKGNIQKAFSKFEFSHEKFWIIDGQEVHLSTGMCLTRTYWTVIPQFWGTIVEPNICNKKNLSRCECSVTRETTKIMIRITITTMT